MSIEIGSGNESPKQVREYLEAIYRVWSLPGKDFLDPQSTKEALINRGKTQISLQWGPIRDQISATKIDRGAPEGSTDAKEKGVMTSRGVSLGAFESIYDALKPLLGSDGALRDELVENFHDDFAGRVMEQVDDA